MTSAEQREQADRAVDVLAGELWDLFTRMRHTASVVRGHQLRGTVRWVDLTQHERAVFIAMTGVDGGPLTVISAWVSAVSALHNGETPC